MKWHFRSIMPPTTSHVTSDTVLRHSSVALRFLSPQTLQKAAPNVVAENSRGIWTLPWDLSLRSRLRFGLLGIADISIRISGRNSRAVAIMQGRSHGDCYEL